MDWANFMRGTLSSAIKSRWLAILSLSVLVASVIAGSYLRLYPVINSMRLGYGPTLYEMDPYSEYWIADKLLKKGLGYFYSLTQNNPETKIFWYPWGRDFSRSELPLLTFFSVVTYQVAKVVNPELTLYDWMVYLPVLFYVITAIAIYLTVRELWGDIPAASASIASSLMFISRHVAGFTVKYSVGLPFMFLAVLFHVRAWRRKRWVDGVLAGVMLSLAASGWAGFNIVVAAIAIQISLLPLIRRVNRKDIAIAVAEYLPLIPTLSIIPFYGGVHYLYRSAGLAIPASLALMLIGAGLQRLSKSRAVALTLPLLTKYRLIYSLFLVFLVIGGLYGLASGFITIRGKALAALGLTHFTHVIVGTVQEYRRAAPQDFIYLEGAAIVVSIPMLVYFAYLAFIKKELNYLFLGSLFILSLISTANISYFFPYLNYVVAIVSSSFVYIMIKDVARSSRRVSWFRKAVSIAIVTIFIVAILAQGVTVWARSYRGAVPTIIEAGTGLGIDIPAWLDGLRWMRERLANDSVIVSWWDYGYWISVIGNRASVADGATLNITQIELLAKALTGTEDEALKIFTKYFRIPEDKLYIAVYEFYLVDTRNAMVYPGPLALGLRSPIQLGADAAKGIAAIYRIAGRKPPTKVYTPQGGRFAYVLPDWTDPSLRNATLFKILLNTAYEVWGRLGYRVAFPYANPQNPPILPRPEMKYFKPAYIGISNALPQANIYVVVSIYKLRTHH